MSEELAPAAAAAYDAYSLAVGGRDPYQHPLEPYDTLHDVYKAAWEAAAHAVLVVGLTAQEPDKPGEGPKPPARTATTPATTSATTEAEHDTEADEDAPQSGRRRK